MHKPAKDHPFRQRGKELRVRILLEKEEYGENGYSDIGESGCCMRDNSGDDVMWFDVIHRHLRDN